MKIIVVVLLAVIVTSIPNLAILEKFKQTISVSDGVLQCIQDADNNKKLDNVTSFCGEEFSDKVSCYSAYSSFKLCLINNNCQNKLDETSVCNDGFRLNWIVGIVGRI